MSPDGPPGAHPGYHHHDTAMHYVIETCDRYGHWSDDPAMLGGGFSEGSNYWTSYRMAASARTQMILIGMDPDRIRVVSRD